MTGVRCWILDVEYDALWSFCDGDRGRRAIGFVCGTTLVNVGPVEVHVSRGRRKRGISKGGGLAAGAMMAGGVCSQGCERGSPRERRCLQCRMLWAESWLRADEHICSSGLYSPRLQRNASLLHRTLLLFRTSRPLKAYVLREDI